jgi:hypothetical protein
VRDAPAPTVPEPSSLLMMSIGLLLLLVGLTSQRRHRKAVACAV